MRLAFIVGSVQISGGNYVVVQHAMHAVACGHKVTIVTMQRPNAPDMAWHPGLAQIQLVHIDDVGGQRFDLAMATWWKTALELHRLDARQYAYFVQSIESRFFDESQASHRRLVDRTYELRLPGITEATWIQQYLAQTYGSEYHLARNGVRKDLYGAEGPCHAPPVPGKLRVLVEGPMGVPIKNTARTVRMARRAKVGETWLLTSTALSWYPGIDRLHSRIPIHEVAAVYRSCDVIVKLSLVEGMFGPPLEMFHCGGTAIVYDVSGFDEYIRHGKNALVSKMHDEAAVVRNLKQLRDDPGLLARLKAGARETAVAWPGWSESSALFLSQLEALRDGPLVSREWLSLETARIRSEFVNELPPAAPAAVGPRARAGASANFRRAKDLVRPYAQLAGYIADGYRWSPACASVHPAAPGPAAPDATSGNTGLSSRLREPSANVNETHARAVDISVIVVNYNTARLLPEMWTALERSRGSLALQVIVVDNASRDDSVALLRRDFGQAQLIVNEANVGFGRANNQGLVHATGRYVLLLNTDAFVAPDTLSKTIAYMDAHAECGVLGVRLVGSDGELQPSCRYFPTPWNVFLARSGLARFFPKVRMVDDMAWDHASVRECDWVVGCYYLVRREVIDQVGLFDPRYFLYCEEVDHCRAVKRAGWKVVYFPDTSVVHLGGESAKSEAALTTSGRQISALQIESELLYFRKHHGMLGALAAVFLATVADGVLALKHVLRPKAVNGFGILWKRQVNSYQLLAKTRLGKRPTR